MTRRSELVLFASLIALAACSDPVDPPAPAGAVAISAVTQDVAAGSPVAEPPSVLVTSAQGRPLPGVTVRFTVESGGGTLTGSEPVTDADGIARTVAWTLGGEPGRNSVRAVIDGLSSVQLVFEAMALPDGCTGLVPLDLGLGDFVRLKDAAAVTYPCLLFDGGTSAGDEYLLLFENMTPRGGFSSAVFSGPATADTALAFTLSFTPLEAAAGQPMSSLRLSTAHAPHASGEYSWDFGAGRIREHTPELRSTAQGAGLVRGSSIIDLNSAVADPVPGDTIQVQMEPIPRLGINSGSQKAVIRFVNDDLIIAEDVRLTTTLMREGGGFNTPLTDADIQAIAAEYAAVARAQSDLFFQGRHNNSVESAIPARITAVHSIMPANDIWGYTYSVTNYFVWDFWVATDGSTRGINQHPQRVTDNLFMHEIAHMRHMGMLQRSGLGVAGRGNRWLVEGFARFTERLPVAARILGTTAPSRTGNMVLPRNPAFNNLYFLDDVPTYLEASSSMYFGYHTSSFVFDYFADQVALSGGDWQAALRELLLAGASPTSLDDVVQRWIPGTTFGALFTRSRMALYTDDIGTPGLPSWTQYHQFKLRESRPAPERLAGQDPRVQWPRITPATGTVAGAVAGGGAAGFIIDGGATSAVVRVSAPTGPHALLSIARIR
ncbi:MAG TPA: hypothetical protein VK933_16855 [Longimicrobiales bacterium]|nr:hypothetical protein [Longimicrobiales bacterium]